MFDKVTQDNLRCYFSTIRTFVPLLRATPESVIVNIGSMAGQRGGGSNLAYAASKAGVDSLTRNLSQTIAPIRVMGVSPGAIETGFVPNPADGYYEQVAKSTPLKRVPTVVDVASAVEASIMLLRFTTGHVINVDGGRWI
jgi:3-oxoacyl-[acyl-carrier protein] reductase